jgi:NDP-sugar pyrophosphorylase family protein
LATATIDTIADPRMETAAGVLADPRNTYAPGRNTPVSLPRARSVQGVVLAGSFPWGDSPLDRLAPRPLLPVAHRPLISYALRWLADSGVEDVVVCVNRASRGARGPIVESGQTSRLDFYEDAEPRGPAGCARDAALGTTADLFVVAEGTSIPTVPLADLLDAHRTTGGIATVVVQQEQPGEGNPCLTRPGGLYVFERRALEQVPAKGFQDIKENLIPRLYRAGEHVSAHVVGARGVRVLNTGTYLEANHYAVLRLLRRPPAAGGYGRAGDALVHRTATVAPDARLVGPVLIGPGCRVSSAATLIGPVVLGEACAVEAEAVVSRTVAWNRCTVGVKAVVDECVLADHVTVEPRARLSGAVRRPRLRAAELGGAVPASGMQRVTSSAPWLRRPVR